jgi:alpha-glucosidase
VLPWILVACGDGAGRAPSPDSGAGADTTTDIEVGTQDPDTDARGDTDSPPTDAPTPDIDDPDGSTDALNPDTADDGDAPSPRSCGELPRLQSPTVDDVGRGVFVCGDRTLRLMGTELGFRVESWDGAAQPTPSHVVDVTPPATGLWVQWDESTAGLCTPNHRLLVNETTCQWQLLDLDGLTVHRSVEPAPPTAPQAVSTMAFEVVDSELWLGCGEHTGPLNRFGTRMEYWNTDAYNPEFGGYAPGASPLYLSVPFCTRFSENGAVGIFVDHAWHLWWDVASGAEGVAQIEGAGPSMTLWVIPADEISEIFSAYRQLTGAAALPPRWALGYHQSRWGYNDTAVFDQLAAEFRNRTMPADVLWFDIQHMRGFRTFTWDPDRFPSPSALLARLRREGFRSVAIADPGIKVDVGWDVYDRGVADDVFLRRPDGTQFEGNAWPGRSVFPDFSLPIARQWWADWIATLAATGVDGIWLDVNEPTTFPEGGGGNTVDNDVLVRGLEYDETMAGFHNVYANYQAAATVEGITRVRPRQRPFVLSRAGFAGLQRYAGVWTGDVPSTWYGLRETLSMMTNVSMSYVPMVGSDVGGYSGGASPELFARWMQLGVLSPFFRGHVTNGVAGQEPWQFGIEVADISRYWLQVRSTWRPYLYSLAWHATRDGVPMLRPVAWHFPQSAASRSEELVMLGPWFLAAPVLDEGATERSITLPEGTWYELESGAAFAGDTTFSRATPLADLPLFVRSGAIMPRWPTTDSDAYDPGDTLFVDVWPHDGTTTFEMFEDDGESEVEPASHALTTFTASQLPAALRVNAIRQGAWQPDWTWVEVRLVRMDRAPTSVQLDGELVEVVTSEAAWTTEGTNALYDARRRELRVRIPAADRWTLEVVRQAGLDALRPPVQVDLEVGVPSDTPAGAIIHIAGDFNGWVHEPLGPVGDDGIARGTIEVPAGGWFFFKYTRGGWETVEKYPACEEARDRYARAVAGPRMDRVWEWRDVCE